MTELTFLGRDRRIGLPDTDQVLLCEFECGDLICRHDIEVNAAALAVNPGVVNVNRIRRHAELLSADNQHDYNAENNTIVGKDAQGMPLDIG